MQKPLITTFEDAKKLASNLSDNLYYVEDFSPSALRTFLDSLPSILHVYANRYFEGVTLKNGQVVIYFERRSVSFLFNSDDWILTTYFRNIRPVPIRLQDDFFINSKSLSLCEDVISDDAVASTDVVEFESPIAGSECGNS